MAKKTIKIYRIRNKFHQILGEYSEKELLSRIAKGKYNGDEEVLLLPKGDWKKIAAQEKLFDAFVKRIVNENQERGNDSSVKLNNFSQPSSRENENKELGKTEHLGELADIVLEEARAREGSVVGGTLRKSDVDHLFERNSEKNEVSAPGLLEKPLDEVEGLPPGQFQPLAEPLNPNKLKALAGRMSGVDSKKRRLVLIALLAVLLIVLFKSGNDERNLGISRTGNADEEGGLSEPISETERRESVNALIEESTVFYSYDSPIDYKAAVDISAEGLNLDGRNIKLLSIHALSLARSIQTEDPSADRQRKLSTTIELGRQLEPQHSGFYRAEAIVALSQGALEEAKGKAQEALEADPTEAENYLVSAEIGLITGDLAGVDLNIERGLKANPNSVRLQHLAGVVAFKKKKWELARKYSGEVARLNPLHSDSYSVVGDIQSERGDLKNAKVLYDLTARLGNFATNSTLEHAHSRLATYYEIIGSASDRGKHELAAEFYKDTVKGREPSENSRTAARSFLYDRSYFEDRGRELLKERKNTDALRFYQALRVLYPKDVKTMVRTGEVMERLAASYEDLRKVMLLYGRASKIDRQNPEPLIRLASLEVEQYNFTRALELLDQAEKISPESAEVKVAFGKFFFRRRDYVRARDYLSKAGTLNPTNSEVYYYYGLLTRLYKPELVKDASRHFYQAYILDVANYDALAEWLKLKVEDHEKNFAIKFVRSLLDADPKNAELYWVFGEVYAANKEARRSIGYYHRALDIDNRASKVRMSLARSLASVGEIPNAVEEFVLASRLDRRSPEGFFEAGQLLFEMKKIDFAEDVLKKLTDVTPNFPGAHRLLARVYQAKGKKDLSIEAMRKEVENNPYNYKFSVEFAELFMSYEEYDKAILELKKVTGLPPESKAPEFRVERVRAYLLLSRSLRAQNKAESAEGAIRSAIQIDPTDPELKRELGYVYHTLQRDKEATEAFNYYLERNPAAQDASLIKALIKKMGTDE